MQERQRHGHPTPLQRGVRSRELRGASSRTPGIIVVVVAVSSMRFLRLLQSSSLVIVVVEKIPVRAWNRFEWARRGVQLAEPDIIVGFVIAPSWV